MVIATVLISGVECTNNESVVVDIEVIQNVTLPSICSFFLN